MALPIAGFHSKPALGSRLGKGQHAEGLIIPREIGSLRRASQRRTCCSTCLARMACPSWSSNAARTVSEPLPREQRAVAVAVAARHRDRGTRGATRTPVTWLIHAESIEF